MTDVVNRPPMMQLPMPPEPARSTLLIPNLAAADRLLIGGNWVKVKKGSVHALPGVAHRVAGEIHPLYGFTTPEGDEAAVRSSAVDGWAPHELS